MILTKRQKNSVDASGSDGVVLLLQVPRTNDKKELAAEQMFASLHGLLTMPATGLVHGAKRERVSFEIAVLKKTDWFLCVGYQNI
jgi:hypothetical protein